MSSDADVNQILWKSRDFKLQDGNCSTSESAALRRDNIQQLYNNWICGDLPVGAFNHLREIELQKYSCLVDGNGKTEGLNSYCDMVESLAPEYRSNLENSTQSTTVEEIINMDCFKSALKQCETFTQAVDKELEETGQFCIPKAHGNDKHMELSSLCNPKEIFNDASNQRIDSKSGNPKSQFEMEKNKQFSIYQPLTKPKGSSPAADWDNGLNNKDRHKRKLNSRLAEENTDEHDPVQPPERKFYFRSAKEQLEIDQRKNKNKQRPSPQPQGCTSVKKSLGARRRNGCFGKFVPPSVKDQREQNEGSPYEKDSRSGMDQDDITDPRLKGVDPKIIELVTNEIMDHGPPVQWDDIAGLEFAKTTIKEIVIWPMLRPDIFTGLRGPPKGILLFGPPGTGKTLIGKCIASQSGATFFSISASSLTSKWVGEGEKMVRALFAVASCHQPAVIFIDEIDSLLTQRCDGEHESSRRIKTEFLVQLDGAATSSEERILVVGATNRPQEIDEAARRRLSKRLYIPLPEAEARKQIVCSLLQQQNFQLSDGDLENIVSSSNGYSGADMTNLCREAALGPIRSLQGLDISAINKEDVRPITVEDFKKAFFRVRPSVSQKDLTLYEDWNKMFGCCAV